MYTIKNKRFGGKGCCIFGTFTQDIFGWFLSVLFIRELEQRTPNTADLPFIFLFFSFFLKIEAFNFY